MLLLGHPRKDIRDTSRYPPLMQTQVRLLLGLPYPTLERAPSSLWRTLGWPNGTPCIILRIPHHEDLSCKCRTNGESAEVRHGQHNTDKVFIMQWFRDQCGSRDSDRIVYCSHACHLASAVSDACMQGRKLRPRALRHLAQEQLGLTIQAGEHNPVDDARAALYLYLRHRKVGAGGGACQEWEYYAGTRV